MERRKSTKEGTIHCNSKDTLKNTVKIEIVRCIKCALHSYHVVVNPQNDHSLCHERGE